MESERTIQELSDLHAAVAVEPPAAPCRDLAAALAGLAVGAGSSVDAAAAPADEAPPGGGLVEPDDALQRKRAVRLPSDAGSGEKKGEEAVRVPTNALDVVVQRLNRVEVGGTPYQYINEHAPSTGTWDGAGGRVDGNGSTPRMLTRCLMCGEDVAGLANDVQRLAHLHLCLASSAWHLLQVECVTEEGYICIYTYLHVHIYTPIQLGGVVPMDIHLTNIMVPHAHAMRTPWSTRRRWMWTPRSRARFQHCCN